MLRILTFLLIGIGAFILICGVWFKPLNIKTISEIRKSKQLKSPLGILQGITAKRVIQKPLEYLSQDKELWTNKLALRLLEFSEAGISLQQLYFLKIICLIICILSVITISYTNANYQAKMIIEYSGEEEYGLFQDKSLNQSRYLLYKQVIVGIGRNKLSKALDTE